MPAHAPAAGAENLYYKADACYKKLQNSSAKKKYRHNWETCIEKYEAVTQYDPTGPWAAAGLFMTGKLNYGLGTQSGLLSDLKKARTYFTEFLRRAGKQVEFRSSVQDVSNRCAQKKGRGAPKCRPGRMQNIDISVEAMQVAG